MRRNPRAVEIEVMEADRGRYVLCLKRPTLALVYSETGYTVVPDDAVADEMDNGVFEHNVMFVQLPFGHASIWIKFDPKTNVLPQILTLPPTREKEAYDQYEHVYVNQNGKYVSMWRRSPT